MFISYMYIRGVFVILLTRGQWSGGSLL